MAWSWSIFVATLLVCLAGIGLARRSMNNPNRVLYGDSGDYRSRAIVDSVLAAGVLAAVITVVVSTIR
jgi:hypothetical protein